MENKTSKEIISLLLTGLCLVNIYVSSVYANDTADDVTIKAKYGDAQAQFELGMMFLGHGKIKKYNSTRGIYWLEEAALRGNLGAQVNLGGFYSEGIIVPKSYETAFKWYKLAAEKGVPIAQVYLSAMYEEGRGVDQDIVTAYALLLIAEKVLSDNDKMLVDDIISSKDRLQNSLLENQMKEAIIISDQLTLFYNNGGVQK